MAKKTAAEQKRAAVEQRRAALIEIRRDLKKEFGRKKTTPLEKSRRVKSTNLQSVSYDEGTNILQVEFKNGSLYQYRKVPLDVYRGLLSAGSKGKYHHAVIRDRFPYKRIS